MKSIKKIVSACVFTPMLILSSHSFAGGSSGAQAMHTIRVEPNGEVFIYGVNNWLNPDGCGASEFIVLLPENNGIPNDYYSEMYALVAAAFLQNKNLGGWVDGCNNNSRPILHNVSIN